MFEAMALWLWYLVVVVNGGSVGQRKGDESEKGTMLLLLGVMMMLDVRRLLLLREEVGVGVFTDDQTLWILSWFKKPRVTAGVRRRLHVARGRE